MEMNEMRIDDYREAVQIVSGVMATLLRDCEQLRKEMDHQLQIHNGKIDNRVPQLNDQTDDTGERLAAAWRRIQRG